MKAILIYIAIMLTSCMFFLWSICDTLIEMREDHLLRTTEIHHDYHYDVDSYGVIKLNGKLVDYVKK